MPLRNDGNTVVGVLRAEMNAEPIAHELLIAIANSKSYPYLIEATSGAVLLDDGKAGFTPPRELRQLLIAPNGAEQYAGARGQDVIGALMPVVLNDGQDVTGWAVVVEQPSSEAFTSVRNSALLLGMLVILVGGAGAADRVPPGAAVSAAAQGAAHRRVGAGHWAALLPDRAIGRRRDGRSGADLQWHGRTPPGVAR